MRRYATALLLLIPQVVFAQAHPRFWTAGMTSRVQAKQAANTSDWQTLLGSASTTGTSCERITQTTAGTGDSLPPVYASREPATYTPPGYVTSGYQGFDYWTESLNLAVCYLGTGTAKYKTQALKIMRAASAPFASVAPASPPSSWRGRTSRPAWYVTGDGAGGQARIYLTSHALANGDAVTISGVLGCTAANTTGKVSNRSNSYFDLVQTDGTTPVICNAPGTNYNHNFASDAGYSMRTYSTMLPLLYDLFYADLSAGDKTNVYATVNAFYDELNIVSPGYVANTLSNYHMGYVAGTAISGILTRGAGENPRGQELYDYWRNTNYELQDQPFFARWLGNNAGFPEAIRYQTFSASLLSLALLAQKNANAEDLFSDFPWTQQLMRYWVHNTTPTRTNLIERGYIASPLDATGTNPNPWKDLRPAMAIIHDIAVAESDAFAPKFKQWVADLDSVNSVTGLGYAFMEVLFMDPAAATSAWSSEPLSLPQLSNPAGGYSRVTMRSDWTTGGVMADIWAGPAVSDAGNGKERYDKGSLIVQRGNVHILVSPQAEATRQNNNTAWTLFSGDRYHYNSIYTLTDTTRATTIRQLKAYYAAYKQPGFDDVYPTTIVAQNPARIDRYEDSGGYVYSRAVSLQEIYESGNYALWFPVKGWTREVLYLRPGVFVVYDRTQKGDRAASPEFYRQEMAWVVGKTPTTASYGAGMYRTEVSDGATYKGALTFVLPAGMAQPTISNVGSYGVVYDVRAQVDADADYKNWLTVVDAADASASVTAVARFGTSGNVDVIRVGSSTVVGFASYQLGGSITLPMTYTVSGLSGTTTHRIAGLAASTTYNVSMSGNDVTIAASGAGSDYASSAAGVLEFTTGAGGTLAVAVGTSSLPSGSDGVAYSQTLSASGGIGAPFTWSKTVGNLPAGLSLSGGGVLSGTPTTAESQTFTVQACDADTPTPSCGTKDLTLVIAANPPVLSGTLPGGVVGQAYTTTVTRTGGVGSVSYAVTSGSLCAGLSLTGATGVVSGTPTTAQVCTFRITATDSDTPANTGYRDYSVTIAAAPYTLALTVDAGSTDAVVGFRTSGLPYSASCTVVAKQGEFTVASATSLSGTSSRRVTLSGLTPETVYGAVVNCEWLSPQAVKEFTTKASASGSGSYALHLKPTATTLARMTALDATLASAKALVYWQAPGEGSYTSTATACSSGCTVSKTSLASGVHSYYHAWIAGTAYATGALNWTHASYPSDGETVTVGSITYTFRDTVAQPFDVKIVPDSTEASYNNLWEAIDYQNWTPGVSPNAPGANYYATMKNPDVVRLTWSAPGNTATLRAAVLGSGGNSIPLSETSASMTVTPLSGGTDATIATSAARPAYVPIP